jgi:hypothetical protein
MDHALALPSLLLPALSTALLSRFAFPGFGPPIRFLLQAVSYTLLVLLPVQFLAALQIASSGSQLSLLTIFIFKPLWLSSFWFGGWLFGVVGLQPRPRRGPPLLWNSLGLRPYASPSRRSATAFSFSTL